MELYVGAIGAIAAVFVVIFGGRGLIDLVRGISERRRARAAVGGSSSMPTTAPVVLTQDVRFTTTSDGVRLAYSTAGAGPPLVKLATRISHLEFDWESPVWGPWWRELAREHMLVRYDTRGCGLSDWDVEDISFDAWVTDLETVVDALGLECFVLFGQSQSGTIAVEYAARHPERVTHLVLQGTFARGRASRGAGSVAEGEALSTLIREGWGKDNPAIRQIMTTRQLPAASAEQTEWMIERERFSASAENVIRFMQASSLANVVARASELTVPALVIHSTDDGAVPFELGRELAASIPNARFLPVESKNHILLEGEPAWDTFVSELRRFLSTAPPEAAPPASAVGGRGSAGPTPAVPLVEPDPVYRRTFVGRDAELKQLHDGFDEALAGHGSLAMVVGEPGIGKTSLCEQLAAHVAERGGKTLVGHCYEEGSLSLPYLAFVEAVRSHVLVLEPENLKAQIGQGADQLARIVPEIRERMQIELAPAGDPEEERYRLLQAASDFLRNAAAVQPLLVVLEDLHDADRGTLDMLTHLARNLSGSKLLVVGTYRDVQVDRAHPLSSALAELRRVTSFERIQLRGLTQDEVHRMLGAIAGHEVPWRWAEVVHRQTEGNPLFVQEVMRYLVEEGLLAREDGELQRVGDEPLANRIPEGLRDVIGKRLTRLSATCNEVLSIASVVGREFRLSVLQRVSEAAEGELFAALEEATSAAVVEQRAAPGEGAVFRFSHAFFRQTLYEEIFIPRRIRLHRQVGGALEEVYGARTAEHAAEIAEHFSQSDERDDLTKALAYSEAAAARAVDVFAYGEAARLLDQALNIQKILHPDDGAKRCDLLLALGDALMPLGEPQRVVDTVAEEAYGLARLLAQNEPDEFDDLAARVCRLALEGLHRAQYASAPGTPAYRTWAERMDGHARPASALRAYADVSLARLKLVDKRYSEGVVLVRQALDTARGAGDPETLFTAAWHALLIQFSPQYWRDAVPLAEEFAAKPRLGVSARTVGQICEFSGAILMASGDRAGGEKAWQGLFEIAERSKDAFTVLNALSWRGVLATMDGRLEDAVQLGSELTERAEELGMPGIGSMAVRACGIAMTYLGQTYPWPEAVGLGEHHVIEAREGRLDQVRESVRTRAADIVENDVRPLPGGLAGLLETCILAGLTEATSSLLPLVRRNPPVSLSGVCSITARVLGMAHAFLGEPDEARNQYRQAIVDAEKVRFRPELALAHLSLAELLLEHYPDDRAEAIEHLDFAIPEFREMKMAPSLERALARRG